MLVNGSRLPKIWIGMARLAASIRIRKRAMLVIAVKTESPNSFSVRPTMAKPLSRATFDNSFSIGKNKSLGDSGLTRNSQRQSVYFFLRSSAFLICLDNGRNSAGLSNETAIVGQRLFQFAM